MVLYLYVKLLGCKCDQIDISSDSDIQNDQKMSVNPNSGTTF